MEILFVLSVLLELWNIIEFQYFMEIGILETINSNGN
jgi:hypothetical protein